MWKDSYLTGITEIDAQHKALFRKTEQLLEAVQWKAGKKIYKEIVDFVKKYTIFHFSTEEEYLDRLGQTDREAHKQAHRQFVSVILDCERKLVETDYAMEAVMELAGTLSAWLLYHIVNSDLKMLKPDWKDRKETSSYVDVFVDGAIDILSSLTCTPAEYFKSYEYVGGSPGGEVSVAIEIVGDIKGKVIFDYNDALAANLLENMTGTQPCGLDGMVCSALAEVGNIALGYSAARLYDSGVLCDLRPPVVAAGEKNRMVNYGGVIIDTGFGKMKLLAEMENYVL